MHDLRLVGLIEGEAAKLSPHGSEVWALFESAAELNEPGAPELVAALPDLERRRRALSRRDSYTIKRLIKLHKGRVMANALEDGCSDGRFASEWRWRTVIEAAYWKDEEAGYPVDLDMTGEDALRRLVV